MWLGDSTATESDKMFERCQPRQFGAEVIRSGEHPCFHYQKITVKESETGQRNAGNLTSKGLSWLAEKNVVIHENFTL